MVRVVSLGLQLQAQWGQTIKRLPYRKGEDIKYAASIDGHIKARNWKETTEC